MAMFPLTANVQGDFVLQLVAVDTDSTMDEVAKAAAHHSVGRRVANRPGCALRVRRQGADQPFSRQLKLADSGLKPMECVEIIWDAA